MIFMAFDGVVTKSIVCELQCLLGGKINKVFREFDSLRKKKSLQALKMLIFFVKFPLWY